MAVAAKCHRKTPKATTGIRDPELQLYFKTEGIRWNVFVIFIGRFAGILLGVHVGSSLCPDFTGQFSPNASPEFAFFLIAAAISNEGDLTF